MKKLITLLLILALALPALALAEEPDPIVGAWYVMLDYTEYPGSTKEIEGRSYKIHIIKFEVDGSFSLINTIAMQTGEIESMGSKMGKWEKAENGYVLSMYGGGTNKAEFSEGNLLVQVMKEAWYVMHPMIIGDWYTDFIFRD